MASYIRKLKKNTELKEIYYAVGSSIKFELEGDVSWRVNKKLEHFSNDMLIEAEGEHKDGGYYSKYVGINKRYWRINE